jgi:hypothetical protein
MMIPFSFSSAHASLALTGSLTRLVSVLLSSARPFLHGWYCMEKSFGMIPQSNGIDF